MAYNGRKAAQWCKIHAQDKQPFVDACAWFASNALWQGGIEMTETWHDREKEKVAQGTVLGTKVARVADRLVTFLIQQEYAEAYPVYEAGSSWPQPELDRIIPNVRLGDLIAYKYYGASGYYNHVSVVVRIVRGVPYVAEWGTAHNPLMQCDYKSRRWDWSKNSDMSMATLYDLVVTHLSMQ